MAMELDRIKHSLDAAEYSMPDEIESIFHYTNVNGALGILRSGKLWFTERRHLNDPSEVSHAVDMMREVLSTSPNILNHFNQNTDNTLMSSDFYISSFSTQPDDLSQWRCYAADGKGVSLGFSRKKFSFCLNIENRIQGAVRNEFKINYDDAILRTLLTDAVEVAHKYCCQKKESKSEIRNRRPTPPRRECRCFPGGDYFVQWHDDKTPCL